MYSFFEKFILRVPLNPLRQLNNLDESIILNNSAFMQALKLASIDLYSEHEKYINKRLDINEETKFLSSIKKYYNRSCQRCTPFGLFAGFSVGEFSDLTEVSLDTIDQYMPHSRLDMYFLVKLSDELKKDISVREKIKFYPNNTIYIKGNKIRYTNYFYVNGLRQFEIASADYNSFIKHILEFTKEGQNIGNIIKILVDDGITENDARSFINELIDNNLLISELSATINGVEYQEYLINKLAKIGSNYANYLCSLRQKITDLDECKLGYGIDQHDYVLNEIEAQSIVDNIDKHFIQTDLVIKTTRNSLNKNIQGNILNSIKVLNKLTAKKESFLLKEFKKLFYKRYEDREIPLLEVLDIESGIGFSSDNQSFAYDNNPLLDGFFLTSSDKSNKIVWNQTHSFLLRKYHEYILNKQSYIEIYDNELAKFDETWDDLPSTISVTAKIIYIEKEQYCILSQVGGGSAINLLGRFVHNSDALAIFANEIIEKEKQLVPNKILAGIVHLPENRVGNILSKPIFRDFEIPYLTRSLAPTSQQIELSDLLVSLKKDKIVLKSKKIDKEIVPHLDCAHNYKGNSTPIYRFLAELQNQDIRSELFVDWGILSYELDFLPQIRYKSIILSLATWKIKKEKIIDIIEEKSDNLLFDKFCILKKYLNLPQHVVLADFDNELYINTNDISSIKILLSLVKGRSQFILKEFLFFNDNKAIIHDKLDNYYTNEFIFSLYKNKYNGT